MEKGNRVRLIRSLHVEGTKDGYAVVGAIGTINGTYTKGNLINQLLIAFDEKIPYTFSQTYMISTNLVEFDQVELLSTEPQPAPIE